MKNEEIVELNSSRVTDELDDWETFQKEEDCVREAVFMYKTKECLLQSCTKEDCFNFHNPSERRRRPFINGKIKYSSQLCSLELCDNIDCNYSHNLNEQLFHPLVYRTRECCLEFKKNSFISFSGGDTLTTQDVTNKQKSERNSLTSKLSNYSKISQLHSNQASQSNRGSYVSNLGTAKDNLEIIQEIMEGTPYFSQAKNDNLQLNMTQLSLNNHSTSHIRKTCPYYHCPEEKRNSSSQLGNSQVVISLSLDNLSTFKMQKCRLTYKHSEKQCTFYHSLKDKRRSADKHFYSSELCGLAANEKVCRDGDFCKKSHNQVEMFYHKEKFKTKFCSFYSISKTLASINSECPYGTVCSFSHCEKEIRIDLIHKLEKNQDFYLYFFKTVVCPFDKSHDKSTCSYAHNLQDFRRNPKKYVYDKKNCSKWDNKKTILNYLDGCCFGYSCRFSHGWKEQDFHPLTYKTTKCKYYKDGCEKHAACPFFHKNELKR